MYRFLLHQQSNHRLRPQLNNHFLRRHQCNHYHVQRRFPLDNLHKLYHRHYHHKVHHYRHRQKSNHYLLRHVYYHYHNLHPDSHRRHPPRCGRYHLVRNGDQPYPHHPPRFYRCQNRHADNRLRRRQLFHHFLHRHQWYRYHDIGLPYSHQYHQKGCHHHSHR